MADILIRGMEMPVGDDWRTIKIHSDGSVWRIMIRGDCALIKGATAVPLQAGHGRLIDANAFEDAFIRYYLSQERNNHLVFTPVEIKQHLADMIGDWPTIVPAEGGGEDG